MVEPHEIPATSDTSHLDDDGAPLDVHSTTGPTVGSVNAARDVNIATTQVIHNAPPAPDEVRYAWLVALAQHYGAEVPVRGTLADDTPYISALRRYEQASATMGAENSTLLFQQTSQFVLHGIYEDWNVEHSLPSPSTIALKADLAALLLLPFIDVKVSPLANTLMFLWPRGLAALSSPAVADFVIRAQQAYERQKTQEHRLAIKRQFIEQLREPPTARACGNCCCIWRCVGTHLW